MPRYYSSNFKVHLLKKNKMIKFFSFNLYVTLKLKKINHFFAAFLTHSQIIFGSNGSDKSFPLQPIYKTKN